MNGEPLRRTEASGVNIQDVRTCLGVKSVRLKIEKKVLERIRLVVRMGNERLKNAMVFGWYECLERSYRKLMERKTVLHCKKILGECGMDWTDVEKLCSYKIR